MGLRPGGQPVAAQILWHGVGGERFANLYHTDLAKPKRVATPAQLAGIDKALAARRTCRTCGHERWYYIPRSLGECLDCAQRPTTRHHNGGTPMALDPRAVVKGYVTALFFTMTDDHGNSFPGDPELVTLDDIPDADVRAEITNDVEGFLSQVADEFGADYWRGQNHTAESVGCDLYFTAARHGAGFWDGDYTDGRRLTEIAHTFTPPTVQWCDDDLNCWST
jgi:hypothetical protein